MSDTERAATSTVPDSFAAYAEDREDAHFTEWLRARSEPDWTRATEHRFTDELAAGTLDDDVFRRYLKQDHLFLRALVSTAGHAVGQSPTLNAAGDLSAFLATVTGEENTYFERSFDALDVAPDERDPEPAEVTQQLENLLGRAAAQGDYEETLAVLLPVEWVYLTWATRVDGDPDQFYLAEWIDLHDNPEFESFVSGLQAELDRYGPDLPPRRQARVADLFEQAVALEVEFFEMAYDKADSTAENTVAADETTPAEDSSGTAIDGATSAEESSAGDGGDR